MSRGYSGCPNQSISNFLRNKIVDFHLIPKYWLHTSINKFCQFAQHLQTWMQVILQLSTWAYSKCITQIAFFLWNIFAIKHVKIVLEYWTFSFSSKSDPKNSLLLVRDARHGMKDGFTSSRHPLPHGFWDRVYSPQPTQTKMNIFQRWQKSHLPPVKHLP